MWPFNKTPLPPTPTKLERAMDKIRADEFRGVFGQLHHVMAGPYGSEELTLVDYRGIIVVELRMDATGKIFRMRGELYEV